MNVFPTDSFSILLPFLFYGVGFGIAAIPGALMGAFIVDEDRRRGALFGGLTSGIGVLVCFLLSR